MATQELQLAAPAEALCRHLAALVEGQLGGGQCTRQRLFDIVSMSIGALELLQPRQSQLAFKERAVTILARVLENIAGHQLGGSTLPLKAQSVALLQERNRQLREAEQRLRAHNVRESARCMRHTTIREVEDWRVRMPPPTTVPAAVSTALSAAAGTAAAGASKGPWQREHDDSAPSAGSAPWPCMAPPVGEPFCTREHVAVRLVPDPASGGQWVHLGLQVQLLPASLAQLVRLKKRHGRPLVVAARRRVLRGMQRSAGILPPAAKLVASLAAASSTGQPEMCAAAAWVLPAGEALRRDWEQRQRDRMGLTTAVLGLHAAIKKEHREKKLRAQRERMAALKSHDVEEYMRLVQGAKNSKIDKLLAQTDQCLRLLTQRLKLAPVGPEAEEGSSGASEGSPSVQGAGQLGALQQSNEAWNKLAKAFEADIQQQPELLTGGELREYQMKGLRWLVGLHDNGLNGILADEMGLGKTIQVISLICYLVEAQREARPFLIAVPASVLPNWEREFDAWAPSLTVVAYKGSAEVREGIFYKQMRGGRGGAFNVCLTTYECLMGKNDRPRLSRVSWSYIVIDEGHRLKNSACKLNAELKQYRAAHRLLLTGTPLQNRLDELWSLLNFLMPSLFNSSDDFQTWFGGAQCRPAGEAAAMDAEDEAAADAAMLSEEEALLVTNRLHQVLRPFMLRRLKETVASELPKKVERLVPCQPSAYQRALLGIIQRELEAAEGDSEGRSGIKGVNNTVMEMRNICNHPLISRLHPGGCESGLPPHCLPVEVRLCGKLELLDRVLVKLHAAGHRVLLFCTMTRLLDVLEEYLDWRGFPFLRMDGSTSPAERGELVKEFNAPGSKAFVFLLSLRAGGVGLNLQSADTVIMYDTDYNPQMDLQAQARAHRLGQTKEVLVLRLQTSGTVEEQIVAVASDKRSMADRSITGGFFDGKTSAAERQQYLLEIIHAAQQKQQPQPGAGAAGQISNDELNRLLARSEEEVALFAAEDRRLLAAEQASWKALAHGGPQGSGAAYSRLATEAEVQLLADQALAAATVVDEDEGREFGRGKRGRGGVSYRDMGERDFKRLCRDGVSGFDGAVKLLDASIALPQAADAAGGRSLRARAAAAPPKPPPAAPNMQHARQRVQQQQVQQQQQQVQQPLSPASNRSAAAAAGEVSKPSTMEHSQQPEAGKKENSGAAAPPPESEQQEQELQQGEEHVLPSSPRLPAPPQRPPKASCAPVEQAGKSTVEPAAATAAEPKPLIRPPPRADVPDGAAAAAVAAAPATKRQTRAAAVGPQPQQQPKPAAPENQPAAAKPGRQTRAAAVAAAGGQQVAHSPKASSKKEREEDVVIVEEKVPPMDRGMAELALGGTSLLGLLGCTDVKQAQRAIDAMDRPQMQDVFEKVKGYAASPKMPTKKLQVQLHIVLAQSAAAALSTHPPQQQQQEEAGAAVEPPVARQQAASGIARPARRPQPAAPAPASSPASGAELFGESDDEEEARGSQQAASSPAPSAVPPTGVRRGPGRPWKNPAPPPLPPASAEGAAPAASTEPPQARRVTRAASVAEERRPANGQTRLQNGSAVSPAAGPAAVAQGTAAAAAAAVAAAPPAPRGGEAAGTADGAPAEQVVAAKRMTASDIKGNVTLSTLSVEAVLGRLSPTAPPLDVATPGGGHACALRTYVYHTDSRYPGGQRIYKVFATSFLKAAGARPGQAFAVFRDAQGGLRAEMNTPAAVQALSVPAAVLVKPDPDAPPSAGPSIAQQPAAAAAAAAIPAVRKGGSLERAAGGSAPNTRGPKAGAGVGSSKRAAAGSGSTASDTGAAATASPTGAAGAGEAAAAPEALVGRQLEVYWPDDKAWYRGKIVSFTGRKHTVAYDDGDTEFVCLEKEKVRFLDPLPAAAAGETAAALAQREQPAAKRHKAGRSAGTGSGVPSPPAATPPPAAVAAQPGSGGGGASAALSPPEVLALLGVRSMQAGRGLVGMMSLEELQEVHTKVFGSPAPAGTRQGALKQQLAQVLAGEF